MRQKIFLYNQKIRKALKDRLGLPDSTIAFALNGLSDSDKAREIREIAINEFGGFHAPKQTLDIVESYERKRGLVEDK